MNQSACPLCMRVGLVTQSHLPLYNLPGSSVRGILQAGILEWAAISSSRESF